jgi:2'-5' RNA ligase
MDPVMDGRNGGGPRVNSFALVSYIHDPLAAFLDRLRSDLVSECHSKAHVTVLPPRPLSGTPEEAWNEILPELNDFQPFVVELGEIEVFPVTDVIYLSVNAGSGELKRLHSALNRGCVDFEEPFRYHPHITLAQDLPRGGLADTRQIAVERWRDYRATRSFVVDELTFVQNTFDGCWMDLYRSRLSGSFASR